jgi:hypothetical protein
MGDALDFEELNRQRMEKDTKELKKLIEEHFVARKKDDDEFSKFEEHVNQRKTQRAEQIKLRQEREKEKRAREEEERKKREEEEERIREEKEENKKLAFIPDRSAIKKKKEMFNQSKLSQKIKDLYAKMAVA